MHILIDEGRLHLRQIGLLLKNMWPPPDASKTPVESASLNQIFLSRWAME
jgi:hypothetical protein